MFLPERNSFYANIDARLWDLWWGLAVISRVFFPTWSPWAVSWESSHPFLGSAVIGIKSWSNVQCVVDCLNTAAKGPTQVWQHPERGKCCCRWPVLSLPLPCRPHERHRHSCHVSQVLSLLSWLDFYSHDSGERLMGQKSITNSIALKYLRWV